MASTTPAREIPFLFPTCLQWTPDGELCAEDRWLLLLRLGPQLRSATEKA